MGRSGEFRFMLGRHAGGTTFQWAVGPTLWPARKSAAHKPAAASLSTEFSSRLVRRVCPRTGWAAVAGLRAGRFLVVWDALRWLVSRSGVQPGVGGSTAPTHAQRSRSHQGSNQPHIRRLQRKRWRYVFRSPAFHNTTAKHLSWSRAPAVNKPATRRLRSWPSLSRS